MKICNNLLVHLFYPYVFFVKFFIGVPSHDSSTTSKFKGPTLRKMNRDLICKNYKTKAEQQQQKNIAKH